MPAQPTPPNQNRAVRRALIILAAVVLLAALGYALVMYTPVGAPVTEAWSIMTLPKELKNATFIADGDGTTAIYHIHGFSFVAERVAGSLVSVEQEPGGIAQVIHTATSYNLMVNGKQVYATTSPVLGVSISPDGSKAVIAVQFQGKEIGPYGTAPGIHPHLWTIVLLHLDGNGAPLALGNGVDPLYMDATHIMRIAPVGLVSADMTTGAATIAARHTVTATIAAALISPDRTYMAWLDADTHSFMVYRVGPGTADKIAEIKDINPRTSYALGNNALYVMRSTGMEKPTQIRKINFSGGAPSTVASVPGNLHISRMLIGSL
ncbi:MAG: hypothetical protein JWO84_577 [Parcubacteria group bacterium]|nr:hypothetical protein [Parcubacteria group bacterium]